MPHSSRHAIHLLGGAALLAAAFAGPEARAREIHGVGFPDTLRIAHQSLELEGLAVKEAGIFKIDVYAIGLYRGGVRPGIEAPGRETSPVTAVVLAFLRDVDQERLAAGWIRDLSKSSPADSVTRCAIALASRLPDVRKGQRITFLLTADRVEVFVDDERLGSLEGCGAGDAVLASFLGDHAPHDLRADLLQSLDGDLEAEDQPATPPGEAPPAAGLDTSRTTEKTAGVRALPF